MTTPLIRQLNLLRDLLKVCKKHNVTLQSTKDRLYVQGLQINKITPDQVHVLNDIEKLPGLIITQKEILPADYKAQAIKR